LEQVPCLRLALLSVLVAGHAVNVMASADTHKEAFRKYLDTAGVIDALTKGTSAVVCCAPGDVRACLGRMVHRPLPVDAALITARTWLQCLCLCTRSLTSPSRAWSECPPCTRSHADQSPARPPARPHVRPEHRPASDPTTAPAITACSYIKACLGGPTPAEYETLAAERESLKRELEEARKTIADLQAKVRQRGAWRGWGCVAGGSASGGGEAAHEPPAVLMHAARMHTDRCGSGAGRRRRRRRRRRHLCCAVLHCCRPGDPQALNQIAARIL
jgi:hypothetical protein